MWDLRFNNNIITEKMFNNKLKGWKEKQKKLNEGIQKYTNADESYYITANRVLNLARKAYEIFESSEVSKKDNY